MPGDKSALNPSGIRLGTPPLTTRGLKEEDMKKVVDLIDQGTDMLACSTVQHISKNSFFPALAIALEIQSVSGPKLVNWKKCLASESTFQEKIAHLRKDVESFAESFDMPGHVIY